MIFRAEAAQRKIALKEKEEAIAERREAVDKTGQLEQKIKNLEKDRDNSKQLSLKAIAARANIKVYLDEEKNRNGQLQQ